MISFFSAEKYVKIGDVVYYQGIFMNELETKIIELSKEGRLRGDEEIEKLLENALKEDPYNIALLLKLALIEFHLPLLYNIKVAALERIFIKDPNNAAALLMFACVQYYCIGKVDETLFQRLTSLTTEHVETDSMLRYAATWFYDNCGNMNENKVEQLLMESITLCQSHVRNYEKLVNLYLRQNRYNEVIPLVQKALKNVVKIYADDEGYSDITDVEEFFNERIKGIYLTGSNFKFLKELEDKIILREPLP